MRALPLLIALCLLACDDKTTATPDRGPSDVDRTDTAVADAAADVAVPDAQPDVSPPDAMIDDATVDAVADAEPPDLAPDAAPPREPVPSIRLAAAEAVVEGSHDLVDGRVLLDPGATLTWTLLDPGDLAAIGPVQVAVAARIWRVEDGCFSVSFGDAPGKVVEVRGDADGAPVWARTPFDDWSDPGAGVGVRPPPLVLPGGPGPWTLRLTARGGSVEVSDVWLVDPLGALPTVTPAAPPEAEPLDLSPCAEPDCDDGAAMTAAIEAAPAGPLRVRLAAGHYTLHTPLRAGRDDLTIAGAPDGATELFWDPTGNGQQAAVRLAGAGLRANEAAPLVGALPGAARTFRVNAPADWSPGFVQIAADDFGEVPPVCLEGRDVERFQRHLSRLVRVLRVEPVDDVVEVTVDRPLNLDVPAEANPRLIPVGVARNIALRDVSLVANCPEALAIANHTEAACTNAQVLDDNGVFFEWTWGALAERVAGQGFGKFTIVVQHSADAAVRDCSMHHPAAYGDGGQGYGVHLIRTGRTVVRGERVDVARHGVVVDFGSTDAQVLDCDLRNMNQALIDVHGEASYDTLIRGNVLAGSTLGVIVGGGGRDVHCNDGPRHHVEDNDIRDCALAAVSISDYTRGLFVRSNALDASGTLFTAAFGGGGALIERNMLGAAGVFAISLGSEGTGDVTVRRNVFTSACTPEQAVLAVLGAERPVLEDNVFCPE